MMKHINFAAINDAALPVLPALLERLVPDGKVEGHEYVMLNPKRHDRHLGSFRINLNTSRWADFAIDKRGGDVISLYAYLNNVSQADAARQLARMLGVYDA